MKTPYRSGLVPAPLTTVLLAGVLLFPATFVPRATPASEDMVEMEVRDVVPLAELDTHAVVLISKDGQMVLPIFVNEVAAVSIALRLAHRSSPYPLAHDLLDHVVTELGGVVTEVRIDEVEEQIYHGRVFITQGTRKLQLDASPSESISMALTRKVRIFASKKVLSQAGISREEIERLRQKQPRAPAQPSPAPERDFSL